MESRVKLRIAAIVVYTIIFTILIGCWLVPYYTPWGLMIVGFLLMIGFFTTLAQK